MQYCQTESKLIGNWR